MSCSPYLFTVISKILLPIVLIAAPILALGQSASISSPASVCLGELITFQYSTSGTSSSQTWDFGDGLSSTQASPSHTFSTPGPTTVSVQVVLANGTSVNATKNIVVHDLPQPDFSLDGSSFCLNNQNICLTDNSTMGTTTIGYASRIVLWGNGATTSSNSPSSAKNICYTGYQSTANNPYTILVEVVNDKGCEAKWQQDISILPDFIPGFLGSVQGADCDGQEVCFTNNVASLPASVASFEWDYGDGSTNTTDWDGECHNYTADGTYTVTLKVVLTNGCENEYSAKFGIKIEKFEPDVNILTDTVLCMGQNLVLSNSIIGGASYKWELYDADKKLIGVVGTGIVQNIRSNEPGDFYVKLTITKGNCDKESRFIKYSAVGVVADFIPLNAVQCVSQDTVYTLNLTKKYPTAKPSYFWDFGDGKAANCFGYKQNCNRDSNENSQHFYMDTGCMKIELYVIDRATGCTSTANKEVSFVKPEDAIFSRSLAKPCLGTKSDYGVFFEHNLCSGAVTMCVDSLKDDKRFVTFGPKGYTQVAHPDGWVTVGFAIQTGDSVVYRSADLTDFYVNPARVCRDTLWFHNWFQLFPEPKAEFKLTTDTVCLPIHYQLEYVGGQTGKLDWLTYTWYTGSEDTLAVADTVPSISHSYTQEGMKLIVARVIDSIGCYDNYVHLASVGYQNEITGDTTICLGQTLVLEENNRYYQDPVAHWRNTAAKESLIWDPGDGTGFLITDPVLSHVYTSKGEFTVRMASKDKFGCVDTTSRVVRVGGVNAAIEQAGMEYLCDQIIQFKDSSYFDFNSAGDFVTQYHWDFGDFTTPSVLKDPFHYYSSNGEFTLRLSVTTRDGCVDTAYFPIYLKGPEPNFDIVSDTMGCAPFTATFSSKSKDAGTFVWRMGDQQGTSISAKSDTTFSFTYTQPGEYFIYLEASDTFVNEDAGNTYTCSALFPDTNALLYPIRKITVLPIPEALFSVQEPLCYGDSALLINKSDNAYTQFNWEINGVSYTSTSDFKFPLTREGAYTVKFYPTYQVDSNYQRHCFDTFENSFTVTSVEASFGFESVGLCSEYLFYDSSINGDSYSWDFGHPASASRNTSNLQNSTHYYGKDSGDYKVCLTVTNPQGCQDSSCADIRVDYLAELSLYNIFTPNGDGMNEEFFFEIENERMYHLLVYNRYGERVFDTKQPQVGWNGRHQNQGKELPDGTYFYVLKYGYHCEKEDRLAKGIVEIVR